MSVLLFDCEVSVAFLFVCMCCLKPNYCFNFSLQRFVVQNADNWRLWSWEIMFTPQILGKLVHLCVFINLTKEKDSVVPRNPSITWERNVEIKGDISI